MRRGSRLSVTPVSEQEWEYILLDLGPMRYTPETVTIALQVEQNP